RFPALSRDYGPLTPRGSSTRTRGDPEFRARLQAHHATHTTPMDRLSFENAFLAASRAAGRATDEAPSRTTRFFDATVNGEQTALKTEGAKSMRFDKLHISKLSEAAWIQDMRSGRKRRDKTMEFLEEFLTAVDRIFILRYYQADPAPHYELVEVPTSHFELVKSVPVSQFNADAPRIEIVDAEGRIMEFRLDRSDSKITISKIEKGRCIVRRLAPNRTQRDRRRPNCGNLSRLRPRPCMGAGERQIDATGTRPNYKETVAVLRAALG
ncbi:MAG: hypothetical protein LC808_15185, partial [Actinobacteria bacterium]|nr:hypothetical protein [Actinomycetota bacterium]